MAASSPSLATLLANLEAALVDPTTAASQLPDAGDLGFERSLSRPFARNLDKEAERILSLVSNVLNWSQSTTSAPQLDGDLIRDGEYRQVIEKVEPLLERADDGIEKHLGIGKGKTSGVGAVGAKSEQELQALQQKSAGKHNNKAKLPANLLHDADLARPQLHFPPRLLLPRPSVETTANEGEEPLWKPLLRRKPHAASSASWLNTELYAPTEDRYTVVTNTAPPSYTRYTHPYSAELSALTPPESYFSKPEQPPRPAEDSFEKTPFEWIGDKIGLDKMIREIRAVGEQGEKELAVDLEHHDYRSWGGITSLMQLSTRKKDYVIDVLNPAARDGVEDLNEYFADPSWIKVFHGAASDIIWLQRDFGVYIVGLFDTYHATHVLGFPQHSLASLLAKYTDFEADKRYQVADWRIRPLNKEMLHYARSDTHYLLDIYDHLRIALHEKEVSSSSNPNTRDSMDIDSSAEAETPLLDVFNRSISTSSSSFSLAPYDSKTGHQENGWLGLLGKHQQLKAYATALAVPTLPIKTGWGPGELKFEVLRAVHEWREKVAREEDESTRWVMGNEQVWSVAERRPRDAVEVMKVVGMARGGVSEVVRRRKEEVAAVVREVAERIGETVAEENEIVMGGVEEGARGEAAVQPAVRSIGGLWSTTEEEEYAPVASSSKVVATSSSFFGSTSKAAASPFVGGLVAAASGFFGSTEKSAVAKGKGKQVQKISAEERAEAVRKVHASLVLGGGLANSLSNQAIPTPPPAPEVATEEDDTPILPIVEEDDHSTALTGDHSYVPLSGRIPKPETPSLLSTKASSTPAAPAPTDSDVLIVSSLADKPKKRRRPTVAASTSTEETPADPALASPQKKKKNKGKAAAGEVKEKAAPLAPHDYSTMKSVLDAEPRAAPGVKEKKKKKDKEVGRAAKGFAIDTSDFRREPRVNNAPKKGNVAQSFAR